MEPLSRVTPATADVLDALLAATDPTWGLQVVKLTGRPAGSVYPILERLERCGWVVSEWEDDEARNGPRRRLYRLTEGGATASPATIERAKRVRSVARSAGSALAFGVSA